ncbi:DUF190 domain-containing protein [Streptomyces brasiliensis]|uniref:UPF0166 protein n=1 Tax=Streptomyces brasiliensis TaxID=1954 RepID=A0A917L255_9ACTN|nr:DUF190 domain-containing protein [Streptomyces brasiliensis]GGJ41472.1 UPF0166 protein [Streptomyces brasiliensis]
MAFEEAAARLTIHLSASARWHHRPAYAEIVHRAHAQGLSGASVFHAIEGYGLHLEIHRDRPSRIRTQGPCAVVVVESEERLRAFLDTLEDVLSDHGLAILDRVSVRSRRHRPSHRA